MDVRNETPEELRERLRQDELKTSSVGAFGDGIHRAENGNFADLAGGLGWKGTGIIILVLIIGFFIYKLLF